MIKRHELLVPCGNFETLRVAVLSGADAVYLGGKRFGARAFSKNFDDDEMVKAIKFAHLYGVKVHVTVNTIIYENELDDALNYLKFLYKNGVDAVIIQDVGLIVAARKYLPDLEIHASTQMHSTNENSIKFLEALGVKRIVFAREVSLDEINSINTKLEKEVFIHGSLCVSYSGECLFSSVLMNRSGNRGECAQICRLPFKLKENNKIINTDGDYLLSTKDLNTSLDFNKLLESDITSFKIEGRMKSPEYVGCVTRLYKDLLDKYYKGEKVTINKEYYNDLKVIFNREYTKGFILNEDNINIVNSMSSNHVGIYLGKVVDSNKKYITIKLSRDLHQEDGIRFNSINKGMIANYIYDMNNKLISIGKKNSLVKLDNRFNIKVGETLNTTIDINIVNKYINNLNKKIPIDISIICKLNKPIRLIINDGINEVDEEYSNILSALKRPITKDDIINHVTRLGDYPFKVNNINIDMDNNIFINLKDLNEIRRIAINKLISIRENVNKNRVINNIIYTKLNNKYDNNKHISVLVRNEEQYDIVNKLNVDRIYIENTKLYLKYKDNNKVFYRTKRVNNKVVNNINTLDTDYSSLYVNHGIGDYYLNVVNHEAINYLYNYSSLISLSVELDDNNLSDLMSYYDNKVNVEYLVYYRPELMIMKYCPLKKFINKDNKCHVCLNNNKYYLVDRNNCNYPIICESDIHLTHILHYKVINKLDKIDYYNNLGINNYRIELFDEDKTTIINIVNKLKIKLNK